MSNKIDNNKSIMMDYVLEELKTIVSTLVIKKTYIADRTDTLENKQKADQYIAAVTNTDVFYTYPTYSDYALQKAGLYLECYKRDKSTIPKEKRDEVLKYQREYIILTYNEPNNYYRALAGLPDIGDEYIYLEEDLKDVDETKPVHDMNKDEIIILAATGALDRLKEKYPNKKYLWHLESEYRIPIHVSRSADDFDILYIKKDRTKQGIADSFIAIYRQVKDYCLTKFYDEAYKKDSPYYDGFIGMFILCITLQRYITTYLQKFINRDFFNKDLIRLLFESYGIPFYNDIPLSYLQKVAKNLNRLLYYKATDRVFTDIFKIFDMDNIDVYNYILFKDRNLDINGRPIEIYKEKTELGYDIETVTYSLTSDIDFYGYKKTDYWNIKQIIELDGVLILLHNNGVVNFSKSINTDNVTVKQVEGEYTLTEDYNISSIEKLEGKNYTKVIFKTKYPNKIYVFEKGILRKVQFDLFYNDSRIEEVLYVADKNINDNMYIGLITRDKSYIFVKGTILNTTFDEATLIHTMEYGLSSLSGNYGSIIAIDSRNVPYVYGNNDYNRLHVPYKSEVTTFESIENRIFNVKETNIFLKGTLFIMVDGSVRVTGTVPEIGSNIQTSQGENEILEYSSVKRITNWKCDKDVYLIHHYNGNIDVVNYTPSDKYGELLFSGNVDNPIIKYRFIKDICPISNGLLITSYDTDKYVYYSGENENRLFPWIKTMSMIKDPNTMKMRDVEVYKDVMYFVTENNDVVQYINSSYKRLDIPTNEYIQKFKQSEDGEHLFVLIGKNYFYILNDEYGIIRVNTSLSTKIIDIIYDANKYIILTNDNKYYTTTINLSKASGGKITLTLKNVEYFECTHNKDGKYVKITPKVTNNILTFTITYTINNKTYTKPVTNLYNCERITINDNVLFIEGKYIQYIKLNEVSSDSFSSVEAYMYDELNIKRARSERINDHLIIYNRQGGITFMRNFPHIDKLDSYIEGDYICLYDNGDNYIGDISFNDTNILQLEYNNKTVVYEPVVEDMYNLRFIVTPMGDRNDSSNFVDSANYLDYDMVVSDDSLWGPDGDEKEFLHQVLDSEFNYVTSKYISVDCRYNITKLNFELCYMFKMLVDLKDAEKYMSFEVPYVGTVNLFDCIVGLFALTCIKFGFDGNIMDTTTKTMSVLGFNFKQDMSYIQKLIEDANFKEKTPEFDINKVDLIDPPKYFLESPEIINLYLENRDIMENIYDYKYSAKTIDEYNVYKRIEQATLITQYSTDMYRREDGTLPATYMEYLKEANPNLYLFIKETNDENMVDQIDNLLMALDTFLKTDKLQYLFLNVPSLSLDNIRKFIYYLIDIFKSYTVDLKAMNILYHVDDKRIHNIKMILWEDNFKKYFRDYTKFHFKDKFDWIFNIFNEYTRIKIAIKDTPLAVLDETEIISLFKLYEEIPNKYNEERLALLADFADIFDTMDESMSIDKFIELVDKSILETLLPYYEKSLQNFEDTFKLLLDLSAKEKLEIVTKMKPLGKEEFKDKVLKNLLKHTHELYNEFDNRLIIRIKDILSIGKDDTINDILPFDFSDHLETNGIKSEKDKPFTIKDTYHFIRNE